MREYNRILLTEAFRHLQYKTQVMINSASDDQRTRLMHTLEVQGIAKTLAMQLKVDWELAETIAAGHDVGHAPFGHAGESALDKCLAENFVGRFSHALQSVRVLDCLENYDLIARYGLEGLGLSTELLRGIVTHDTDSFVDNVTSPAFRLQYDLKNIKGKIHNYDSVKY